MMKVTISRRDEGLEVVRNEATEVDAADVVRTYLSRHATTTRQGYLADLKDFAAYLQTSGRIERADPFVAAAHLVGCGFPGADLLAVDYLTSLAGRGLSVSTRNRRLSALRFVARVAKKAGLVAWRLDVGNEHAESYRDTRGPALPAVRAMFKAAVRAGGLAGQRDVALLWVLYSLGLRRAEVCNIDVDHLDRAGSRLSISGKGKKGQRRWITLPRQVLSAITDYLRTRGDPPSGPLFENLDRAHKGGGRLTPAGLYGVVRALARHAGLDGVISPHRLRHAAITQALDGTGGDVRRVKRFSRHAKIDTLLAYDDNRVDQAGEISTMLANGLGSASTIGESGPDHGSLSNCPPGEACAPPAAGPAADGPQLPPNDRAGSHGAMFMETPIVENIEGPARTPIAPDHSPALPGVATHPAVPDSTGPEPAGGPGRTS
jgi:integrase/recombinase XerC